MKFKAYLWILVVSIHVHDIEHLQHFVANFNWPEYAIVSFHPYWARKTRSADIKTTRYGVKNKLVVWLNFSLAICEKIDSSEGWQYKLSRTAKSTETIYV